MDTINRSALIVRPKQPFSDWAHGLDDEGPTFKLDEHRGNPVVVLVEDRNESSDLSTLLKQCWQPAFEEMLKGWWTDEDHSPQKRTLGMFKDWFDVELADLVFDAEKSDIDRT